MNVGHLYGKSSISARDRGLFVHFWIDWQGRFGPCRFAQRPPRPRARIHGISANSNSIAKYTGPDTGSRLRMQPSIDCARVDTASESSAITVMPSVIRPTGRRNEARGGSSNLWTMWRAASTIATHRKGISISSAICTPSRGTRSGTRIMPRTKPVPNTRAKQTAPALTISMAYLFAIRPVSSRAMPNPSSNISTPPAAYTASYPAATATCPPITGPSPWPT